MNELDELTGSVNADGRETNVINRQMLVETGPEALIFQISIWVAPLILISLIWMLGLVPTTYGILYVLAGLLPGVVFEVMKVNALAYLRKLQQKIQADASQIDNYLEQRVIILNNVSGILGKAIDLDKDVMKTVAAYRGSSGPAGDIKRNATSREIDGIYSRVRVAFEAYPDLRAHAAIADAMQQNSYLQKEITAARTLYNDTVAQWNQDIFAWPTKQIVAARNKYTTRIPFTAAAGIKATARSTFF